MNRVKADNKYINFTLCLLILTTTLVRFLDIPIFKHLYFVGNGLMYCKVGIIIEFVELILAHQVMINVRAAKKRFQRCGFSD